MNLFCGTKIRIFKQKFYLCLWLSFKEFIYYEKIKYIYYFILLLADSQSPTSKLARRSKQNVSCRRNQRYQTDVGWRTLYPNECRWQKIIQYSFKTGKETGTIFDVNTARDCSIKSFDDYIMSPDEKLILIQTETKPIYRRSFTANYYIFNVKNNKMEPLSENGPQQVPLFSPDGNQIAFVRDNNIYLVKLLFGNSESQVTKDGKFNEVLMVFPTGYMKRNSASTVLSTSVQTARCLPISVLMRVKYLCILFHYTKVWFPH